LAITTIFVLAFAVVQPRAVMVSMVSVEEFYKRHIEPKMEVTASYYEPSLRYTFNVTAVITFPPLEKLQTKSSVETTPDLRVNPALNERTSERLLFTPTELVQLRHYYDGRIEQSVVDVSEIQNYIENGYYYEGFIPSPEQVADFIAWSNGWQVSQIVSAKRWYETGNTPVSYILEEELPDMNVNSSYDSGELTIIQSGLRTQAITPFTQKPTRELQMAWNITYTTPFKDFGGTAIIILIGLLITAFGAGYYVATTNDNTPYSQQDLARAYENGWNQGVNETIDEFKDRLNNLLQSGQLDNETYVMLNNEVDETYGEVKTRFTNPYDIEGTKPQGNSWIHTIISVIEQAIVITIIVIIIILCLWIVRKSGILKRGKGKGGDSAAATYIIK